MFQVLSPEVAENYHGKLIRFVDIQTNTELKFLFTKKGFWAISQFSP